MSIDNSGAVLEAGQFDGAAEFRQQLLRPKEHGPVRKRSGDEYVGKGPIAFGIVESARESLCG